MGKLNKKTYEIFAGIDWPSYEDYKNSLILDDKIKQEILEIEKDAPRHNISSDFLSVVPLHVDINTLTADQNFKLTNSEVFCMLPWIHLYAFPDGRAYPCCVADYQYPLGDLRKHTMGEIWNHTPIKELRANILADKKCKECVNCYEQDRIGAFSARKGFNRSYGHHISDIEKTLEDGTHPEFKIRYWDVRFSNICNFRCRSCGPAFSSSWYNDHNKLHGEVVNAFNNTLERIEYTTGDEYGMLEQMEQHIPYIEQIYFAGGEPLLMKEHYWVLDKLLEYGKTDVNIIYNTNFSEFKFKDKHIFDYWKKFKNVSVGASLDGMGPQAELIRKGQNWSKTVANRIYMMKQVPHVEFFVASTVSSMNVLHILDFHKKWVSDGIIGAGDLNVNICQGPEWYRADIFPEEFKQNVIVPAYKRHIEWLTPLDKLQRTTNGFKSMLNFIIENNGSSQWGKFVEEINKIDSLRNENFWELFPEFGSLIK